MQQVTRDSHVALATTFRCAPARAVLITMLVGSSLSCGACSDGTSQGSLGIAGASCLSSLECARPLQCVRAVCIDPSRGADVVGGGAQHDPGDTSGAPSWTDAGGAHDAGQGGGGLFESCGELGVSSAWTGDFEGEVHIDPTTSIWLGMPPGTALPVEGDLDFEIDCVESKFVLRGAMDGIATVQGQGAYPFAMSLRGVYDRANARLVARMIDGKVVVHEGIEVYFEGDFVGDIQPDGQFDGTWENESTGTNVEGLTGEATGEGTWDATPDS